MQIGNGRYKMPRYQPGQGQPDRTSKFHYALKIGTISKAHNNQPTVRMFLGGFVGLDETDHVRMVHFGEDGDFSLRISLKRWLGYVDVLQ